MRTKTIGTILPFSGTSFKKTETAPAVKFCNWLISASLFLIFLLGPLFFVNLTFQGIIFEKYVFFFVLLLIGLVAWATKAIILGGTKIRRSFLDWPILLFLLAVVLSTIFSVSKATSLFGAYGAPGKGLIGLLALFVFVYFLVNNFNKRRRLQALVALAVSDFLFLVLFALAQFVPADSFLGFLVGFNPLVTTGAATIFVGALVPLLLLGILGADILWTGGKKNLALFWRGFFILTLALNLVFLFGARQYVFWPATIVGVLVFLVFLISRVVKTKQSFASWPIAVFLALVFFYVVGNVNVLSFSLPAEVGLSQSLSWQVSKNSLGENLVLGSGPSTFKYDFAKFKTPDFNQTIAWNVYFDSARGFFFETLATLGVAGTLTLVLLLATLAFVALLVLIRAQETIDKLFLAGGLGALGVLLVSAFFLTFNSAIILFSFLVGGFLYACVLNTRGFSFPETKLSLKSSPQNAILLASTFLLISAGVVVFFALLTRSFIADYYARQALAASNFEQARQNIERAIELVDYQPIYYARLGQYYMALVNEEVTKKEEDFDRVRALSYLQTAISAAKKSYDLNPNDVEAASALAAIYENATLYIGDARDFANQYYQRVTELDSANPVPYVRLGFLQYSQVNDKTSQEDKQRILSQAIVYYQKALELKPNLPGVYSGIALAYEAMDDFARAEENALKAIELAPQSADYRLELARLYFNRGVKEGTVAQQELASVIEGGETQPTDLSLQPAAGKTQEYLKMNQDLEAARKILVNLTEVYGSYANAHYLLGLLYERTGQISRAKESYQKTLELLPDGQDKILLKEKIDSL